MGLRVYLWGTAGRLLLFICDLDIIDRIFFFNLKILRLNSLKFILRGYLYFYTFLGIVFYQLTV